jgi:hypothetical protein
LSVGRFRFDVFPHVKKLLRYAEGAERFLVLQYEEAPSAYLNNAQPEKGYSTVTLLAKLRGLSTSVPRAQAV